MKLRTITSAATLVAAGLFVTQPAQAAPQQATATCSFKVPPKLAMNKAWTTYAVPLGSDCPSTMYNAVWTATWKNGFTESVQCQQGHCPGISLQTKYVPVGKVTWVGEAGGGTDKDGNKVATLLPAYTEVRYASSASVNAGRKGARTAFLTTVWYFNPKTDTYARWAGRRLLIQYQEIGTTTWKGLAYATTNASGQAAYTYYPGRTRRYRVYVPASTSVWDFYTPVISR
ncbi:hypothetical protein [Kribbella sp.]|uniref:hypothetical protein n=1 Tax=Kribbella sp. TaxID=1871183 RepID=UPI002D53F2B6|nr:hypothetical protein [Kribbella sp.]HZX07465.1 hypothetical protein [Kribbella sp.]